VYICEIQYMAGLVSVFFFEGLVAGGWSSWSSDGHGPMAKAHRRKLICLVRFSGRSAIQSSTVRLTDVWWLLAESEYNFTTDQHKKWRHQRINQLCSLHLVKYFKGNASYAKHVLEKKTFINPPHLKIIPTSAIGWLHIYIEPCTSTMCTIR
jgi:hypothetical protein